MKISNENYMRKLDTARKGVEDALRDSRVSELVTKAREISAKQKDHPTVRAATRVLMKAQYDALQKVNPPGVGTWLGFNFYDLRGPAYFIFPLLTPFIQMIPKRGKVNAGVGTVAHWKATRNPNSTYIYAGVQDGSVTQLPRQMKSTIWQLTKSSAWKVGIPSRLSGLVRATQIT